MSSSSLSSRRHLAGVGVDRVAPEQHQVEPTEHVDRARERLGGGPRVASGERGIGDVHTVIRAEGNGLAQHVLGTGWAERDHGERATGGRCELTALGHRAPAIVVHVELDAVALEASIGTQRERFDLGDLLDECSDPERLGHGSTP
jgi:hypothetical protein